MEETKRNSPEVMDAEGARLGKKKSKKWSFGGLFKRRRNKSSDTDSSSDTGRSFLGRRRKTGSRKVVGKFETIVLPKDEEEKRKITEYILQGLERYEKSPMVKRRVPNGVSHSHQEIATKEHLSEMSHSHQEIGRRDDMLGSSGSLDAASRRNDKQKVKARVEALRSHLMDNSSSSDDCTSSKTSNSSLRLHSSNEHVKGNGSLSRKSRAARTDRYIRRHSREDQLQPIGSPKNRWVAKVVYQQSNDYTTRYTARTHSANSSPMSSPMTQPRFSNNSLPSKTSTLAQHNKELVKLLQADSKEIDKKTTSCLSKVSPPPPPPRNPNRKVSYALDRNDRPSSYAFDANACHKDVTSYVKNDRKIGFGTSVNLKNRSNSDQEIHHKELPTCKVYSTDKNPRSRNPIQVITAQQNDDFNKIIDYDETVSFKVHSSLQNSCATKPNYQYFQNNLPLNKANEIGIPTIETALVHSRTPMGKNRPLSIVLEKSDTELLCDSEATIKSTNKPRNLEEALDELEEIYNSLKLGDEDLLDRADRRDLQSALKNNPQFFNYMSDGEDELDNQIEFTSNECSPDDKYIFGTRIPAARRSARPDTIADDMAFRKLNRKESDPKTNPNVISQSGSFLLVSPALSPPPIVSAPSPCFSPTKEPDITLDDVVYRNLRQANNTLKVMDPQLPFGIPIGPVSPAPNSDYLHAIPSDRYKSTFNPSRNPDVVKDDLAYRNLRKEFKTSPGYVKNYMISDNCASKKRRAIRSLSANLISLIGNNRRIDNDAELDINFNDLKRFDKALSFNNLSNIADGFHKLHKDDSGHIEEEIARTTSKSKAETRDEQNQKLDDKKLFTKNVALHKPITLSQFKINECLSNEEQKDSIKYTIDEKEAKLRNLCQNFNWNNIKVVCAQYKPLNMSFEDGKCLKLDADTSLEPDEKENSSSGVSSTSDIISESPQKSIAIPAASNAAHNNDVIFVKEPEIKSSTVPLMACVCDTMNNDGCSDSIDNSDNIPALSDVHKSSSVDSVRAKEIYLDENVIPTFEEASEQYSRALDQIDGQERCVKKNGHCSRIEITLATPEPTGVHDSVRTRSYVETKDAAVMTEEFGMSRSNEVRNRVIGLDDGPEYVFSRCREGRRRQLVTCGTSRNYSDSSSTTSDTVVSRKTTFRAKNTTKDDEARRSKISNVCRTSNRARYCDSDRSPDTRKNNAASSVDSKIYSSNRDKSAKRKSFLNQSSNSEKTLTSHSEDGASSSLAPSCTTSSQHSASSPRRESPGEKSRIPKRIVVSPSIFASQCKYQNNFVNSHAKSSSPHLRETVPSTAASKLSTKAPACQTDATKSERNTLLELLQTFKSDGDNNSRFVRKESSPQLSLEIIEEDEKPSILKRKSDDITASPTKPTSILKRKEETSYVVEPIRKLSFRQGILKKHASLDETETRHRSCSPEREFRPILKPPQRRCSLDELRTRSPGELHSILKKPSDDSDGWCSPASILKRKMSESSSVDSDSEVRPILKWSGANAEPKPILKKKSDDDKRAKPILKKSDDEDVPGTWFQNWMPFEERRSDIKPILKNKQVQSPDRNAQSDDAVKITHDIIGVKRHSIPGLGESTRRSFNKLLNGRIRPLSVAERVLNLESFLSEETVSHSKVNGHKEHMPYENGFSGQSTTCAFSTENKKKQDPELRPLRRSNSVSEKASMFSRMEKDSKQTVNEVEKYRKKEEGGSRKLRIKCLDVSRFSTQPVTSEEVAEAKKQNEVAKNEQIVNIENQNQRLSVVREDEEDPCNLSLKERALLFAGFGSRTRSGRTGARFSTQPVTEIEIRQAKKISLPNVDDKSASKSTKEIQYTPASDNFNKTEPKESTSVPKLPLDESETGSQSDGDTSSSGGREIQSIINGTAHHQETNNNFEMNAAITVGKDVVDEGPVINGSSSIAQRLAALQRSGQVDWKKRISRIAPEHEVPVVNINETQELLRQELQNFRSPVSSTTQDASLASRLERLETSSKTWRNRVEPTDAASFSVAGRMAKLPVLARPRSPSVERKSPAPARFRSFRETKKELVSGLKKIDLTHTTFHRSVSLPSDEKEEAVSDNEKSENRIVTVPQIFDDDFSTFFGIVHTSSTSSSISSSDFELSDMKTESTLLLPFARKNIKMQRKHTASGNPLKTLNSRIDIKHEYREVKTNVAEREMKRINVEKVSKNSSLAIEVLAGLASKEDFSAVHLKKAGAPIITVMLPYKPLMLMHIKGRRHVQTRLVEPNFNSINSGDSYVLVTPNEIFHWIGKFSNIIERSRGSEIAQHILMTHDLGCSSASQVNTIVEDSSKLNTKAVHSFWMHLGADTEQASVMKAVEAGHPDEDEIYESSLISTNMVYEALEEELVPLEKCWGTVPKIQILDPNKVLIFDFGSEMYIWLGKNVDLNRRKSSTRLAKELWDSGFNYEECDLCPITSCLTVGSRNSEDLDRIKVGKERPEWCLLAKVTQHMETVLFREKFLDWPDFSRVIRAKGVDEDTEKQVDAYTDITPCDAQQMLDMKPTEPDLFLEGSHLGRGNEYFDEDLKRYYSVITLNVQVWHISEFESEEIPENCYGQFYSGSSYIVRWLYTVSHTGRELSGLPSKHSVLGRDRCVYFCWQGKEASLNEQGAAALLTVELDKEKGPQIRICQGYEPPAFFNLFQGRTVIYKRKNFSGKKWRLFICRGEMESEASLLEVTCNIRQLRSRASFVLINVETGIIYLWHGCKITDEDLQLSKKIVDNLKTNVPSELGLHAEITINEVEEGKEPKEFFTDLGSSSRKLYASLLQDNTDYTHTPMLFNLSSNSGTFCATPIWSPCRHLGKITAYPYLQEDLYSASQPALFLLDTGHELWLWQGWWPERERTDSPVEGASGGEYRGGASVRWQLQRRAAMQTALDYGRRRGGADAFMVWAGLEPVQFTNLFAEWCDRDDIAEMNILDGRKPGEVLDVKQELARLTQSTYPIEQLLQRPLPDGVDPTKLELYLSPQHFQEVLKMTKEEFASLPLWKQTNLKKSAGLF